ncbi:MAG: glycosyltransferase family 2 protein [Bacteroidaceae bacterium]|nr:glycosyltransferase family 2 protein [Bacteroidaceae bacterium]
MKINVVVVTYNRLDLLKETLENLQRQTFKINKIIVVNNASTDGTTEYLRSFSKNLGFSIMNLKKNLGGAGGFYYGIRRAYEIGCDYMWIMDDDTIVTETALDKLIKGLDNLKDKKIGFLTSNVLFKDGSPCLMNIPTTVYVYNEFIEKGIVEVSHTSFVAMLIPAKVVEQVGLPIKDYFIWGDDGEYSTRILRAGYAGYLIGDSTVYHYMKENVGVDIFNTPKDRIDRFFYFYRNNTITSRMRGALPLCKRLMYHGFLVLMVLFRKNDYKIKKIWTIIKGTFAGLFMKVTIDKVDKNNKNR